MIPILPDRSQLFGMPIPVPSSLDHLPPLRFPDYAQAREASSLQQSLFKQAGLRPGVYSSLDKDLLQQVTTVYNGLMDALTSALSGLDIINLCVSLYKRHEEFLGNINKFRYESIPNALLVGRTDASMKRQQLWELVAPYTISIRWLIEICVKRCQFYGTEAGQSKLDFLIELASGILVWDTAWEFIYSGVLPHEVTVGPDYELSITRTARTVAATIAYQKATAPWRVSEDRDWINNIFGARSESAGWTVDKSLSRIDRDPEWGPLSKAMEKELGYSAIDMLRYSGGLIDSFDPTEYIKVIPKDELGEFMSRKWKLSPERFELLLTDHALSKQSISDYSLDQLRPAERAGRDTRLVRRPVVLLEGVGSPSVCLYGVETLETSNRLFLYRFPSGRIQLPRMSNSGPVKRAIGSIQTKLGNALRDEIADLCKRAKYTVAKEKNRIRTERIPAGAGFGPVDVFIVDRRFHRFVLAETKDAAGNITVPAEVRDELVEFQKYVGKMEKQADWFRTRVEALKSEFGIAPEDDYTVEGVIIVNYPRLWMYDHQEQLPVVADKHFYEILERGDRFLTTPVRG